MKLAENTAQAMKNQTFLQETKGDGRSTVKGGAGADTSKVDLVAISLAAALAMYSCF